MKSCHTTKDIKQIKHDGNVLPSSRKCAVDRRRVIESVVKGQTTKSARIVFLRNARIKSPWKISSMKRRG